ncbi:tRNA-dihydrouridine(47) synthase [NAD(P)(+)] [Strongyloides ratti]|uniref:tRNA-dihydrouridine(47) synthase [NAD(P)(+)] n=1 Tax=Strongyloides ratti TaxID=34506 RepID=A0A090L4U8_STRRB|nr:tRNA-dihydrouridine(47) synthase [NAD(P)(+)] [Strongyloides ratti]CEF64717.1 tRNA-dihydrouridine(47) synthase [NAD(P)(+)] [Strongyloides ratti]
MKPEVIQNNNKGVAPVKKEFIVDFNDTNLPDYVKKRLEEEKEDRNTVIEKEDENGEPVKKKARGMNKGRRKEMDKARIEISTNQARLCPSTIFALRNKTYGTEESTDKKCRFGDKCKYYHSLEEYSKVRQPDIGEKCYNFEIRGVCPYNIACRFHKDHTLENFEQKVDEKKKEEYEKIPVCTMFRNPDIKIMLNKNRYNFKESDELVKGYNEENVTKLGAMEREKASLKIKEMAGKPYLAPLTTVGNLPFRRICVKAGCKITCGEMALATNIVKGIGSECSLLKRHHSEKIFGVQIAGGFPDTMTRAAQVIKEHCDVDFVDINMGCPIELINSKGGGCALPSKWNKISSVVYCMKNILTDIPLTIKVRSGIKEGDNNIHKMLSRLVNFSPPDLITLHPRSKEQRYTKLADWDYVETVSEAIDKKSSFWVCGDITSWTDYYDRLENKPIDGIMIGRAALIKPWIFTEIEQKRHIDITASERLEYIQDYVNFGLEHWGSDDAGLEATRRFLLEWLSFTNRYIPVGMLEVLPQRLNERPPYLKGRNEMEHLLSSPRCKDWIKISEMFLGPVPQDFVFVPKHKANSY